MTKSPFMKAKSLTFLLLVLISIITPFSFLPYAKAEVIILSMSPLVGQVGTMVYLEANITNSNGRYALYFDDVSLLNGTAVRLGLNASFAIPDAIAGNHTVKLSDVNSRENATQTFTVITAFFLNATIPTSPQQWQEGDSVPINLTVTGGDSSILSVANVTVMAPNNISYSTFPSVTFSSSGYYSKTVNYTEDFPISASTKFAGEYRAFFNGTFAATTFRVGLTKSLEYHRFQTVDVKAVRELGENVSITITGTNVLSSENATADNVTGIVHYTNWAVPQNASIGSYAVSITSLSSVAKTPADVQNFTVPGYSVNITTLNLAGEVVPSVVFRVLENGTSVGDRLSDSKGLVFLMLEIGNYTREAYYKNTKVGNDTFPVVGDTLANFSCSLTNLRITVKDETGNSLPQVKLFLTPDNLTLATEINGTASVHSLLPNATYTLNASRYDIPFNTTTIAQLPATDWFDVPIVCPTLTLQVNVTNANRQPINNALVKVQELLGGLHYQGSTTDGVVALNCTLGRYTVEVYANGIKLNETTVDLNETIVNLPINCGLYGLDVSIKVVDYFGQAIPNVNITLQRVGWQNSTVAGSDGLVAFPSIIGGSLQVTIRLSGQPEPCVVTTTFVDSSRTIEIKIEKYTLLAGMLVETSQLLTAILIVIIVVLLLVLEILRRRRRKPQESEKLKPE